jgi:histidinol-phosphate aminotransferase
MAGFSIAELCRPELAELTRYGADEGDYPVRLDANEAPPLLSEAARARVVAALSGSDGGWERYPDPSQRQLRAAIAQQLGVSTDEVLAGAGSDELIALLLTAFVKPQPPASVATVLTLTPSFVMYRVAARCRGLRVLEVPLDAAWDLPSAALESALAISPPNLVLLASPNNPTGNVLSQGRLERLIQAAPRALIVIDEAYVAYADADQLELYRRYDNVAILRTLSKVGFAALRVGFLLARTAVVRELDKVRLPYNVPTPSARAAELVLRELGPEIGRLTAEVVAARRHLTQELERLPGLSVTPSQANFLWLRSERAAADVFEGLKQRGILVRSFHARGGRLAHQLRVTLGTAAENAALLDALRELV